MTCDGYMHYIVLIIIILCVIYGPGLWAQHVLSRYGKDEYFSGNGFNLARLLLKNQNMSHVTVEQTDQGDHFDPQDLCVRLTEKNCGRKSLTAVVVAAHEVGHAMQASQSYTPLAIRTKWVHLAFKAEKIGAVFLVAAPLVTADLRAPGAGVIIIVGGFLNLCVPLLVHLITIPVELDASFNRALPLLKDGGYIPEDDLGGARRILLACALTYVAGALAELLNIWRWLRLLRR